MEAAEDGMPGTDVLAMWMLTMTAQTPQRQPELS